MADYQRLFYDENTHPADRLAAPLLAQFDPAIFLALPVHCRGHAMWSLPTLNENDIKSGIEDMAKLNYGGFFIEPGGGRRPDSPTRTLNSSGEGRPMIAAWSIE